MSFIPYFAQEKKLHFFTVKNLYINQSVCLTPYLGVFHLSVHGHWDAAAALLQMTSIVELVNDHLGAPSSESVLIINSYQLSKESSLGYAAQHSVRVMQHGHHLQDVDISGTNLHCQSPLTTTIIVILTVIIHLWNTNRKEF